jgi:AcrR family transcriptional regulator
VGDVLPVRRRDPDAKRARLLAGARASLAEHGYSAAIVADICSRANVAVGTFYQHFENKADLIEEVSGDEHLRMLRILDELRIGDGEQLEAGLTALMSGDAARLYRAFREAVEVEPLLREHAEDWSERTHEHLQRAVERARRAARMESPALDARSVSWAIAAMLRGALGRLDAHLDVQILGRFIVVLTFAVAFESKPTAAWVRAALVTDRR